MFCGSLSRKHSIRRKSKGILNVCLYFAFYAMIVQSIGQIIINGHRKGQRLLGKPG